MKFCRAAQLYDRTIMQKKLAENGNPAETGADPRNRGNCFRRDFAEDEEFRLYLDDGTFVGIYQYRPSQKLNQTGQVISGENMRYLTKHWILTARGDSVVTLGKFDGASTGGICFLIRRVLAIAEQKDWKRFVFTFDVPPQSEVQHVKLHQLLTNEERGPPRTAWHGLPCGMPICG